MTEVTVQRHHAAPCETVIVRERVIDICRALNDTKANSIAVIREDGQLWAIYKSHLRGLRTV